MKSIEKHIQVLGGKESHLKPLTKREPQIPTSEEKFLESVKLKKGTKQKLSKGVFYYETEDDKEVVFKTEGNYLRERAAYIIDKFIGFDLVPTNVVRSIGKKTGCLRRFVPNAPTGWDIPKESTPDKEEFINLTLFKFLINDLDCGRGNIFIENKHIIAYDNDASQSADHLYTPLSYGDMQPFSVPIPQKIRNKIIDFSNWKEGKQMLRESLGREDNLSLNEAELSVFFKRLDYLIGYAKRGYFHSIEEYEELKGEYEAQREF